MQKECEFGNFLKALIKDAGMTQYEFYSELGIKKAYFYDILSGRVNPPPPELQFRTMDILKVDERTKKEFYDLAAKGRGDFPADIAKAVKGNPKALDQIRKVIGLSGG